jgi:hypothetical protein
MTQWRLVWSYHHRHYKKQASALIGGDTLGNHCEQTQQNRFGWGCVSATDSDGRTIWIADAHRDDRKRFVVLDKAVRYVNKAGGGIDEHLIKLGIRIDVYITAPAKPAWSTVWWSSKIKRLQTLRSRLPAGPPLSDLHCFTS